MADLRMGGPLGAALARWQRASIEVAPWEGRDLGNHAVLLLKHLRDMSWAGPQGGAVVGLA